MNFLDNKIELLPATSSITIRKLKSLDIDTYYDLINYFPVRYEDYSLITKVDKIQIGEIVTITGKMVEIKNQYTRSRITIQKILINDGTGTVEVNWFNQPFLIRIFKIGETISVAGLVKKFDSKIQIEPKEFEIGKKIIHTGRLIPIYSEKKGLSTKTIRGKIYTILDLSSNVGYKMSETLPKKIILFNQLMGLSESYRQIHFPDNLSSSNQARRRLAFNELFELQLTNDLVKKEWQKEKVGNQFKINKQISLSLQQFTKNLSFKLTRDQKKVLDEINTDLKKTVPMNRFLQGDVGSGKTVVAAIACYLAFLNKYKSIIMAPTEILAQQHYHSITDLFKNNKLQITDNKSMTKSKIPKIQLITGSTIIRNSQSVIDRSDIIIGTHALLNKNNKYKKVGLVVIDEQHRFGVNQRALLKEKSLNSHLLTMTATPIPRTVALTLYGELDQSYIEEMPKGRQIIKTFLIPKEKRVDGYEWIKKQITENNAQAFIVCPLIEESESETLKSIKAVKIEFESLKKIFPNFKLGLLHGKIKNLEKQRIMSDFRNRDIDILVSTPVVEVGIDIPGATIMIIEGAERFGLAQLHQLRGRVGRSNKQSYCLLYSENLSNKTIKRLNFFCKNNLGVKLAEFDLINRGAGNIFGTKQHGFVNLKIANLYDFELINKTKGAVEYFMKKYKIKDWEELNKKVKVYKGSMISKD